MIWFASLTDRRTSYVNVYSSVLALFYVRLFALHLVISIPSCCCACAHPYSPICCCACALQEPQGEAIFLAPSFLPIPYDFDMWFLDEQLNPMFVCSILFFLPFFHSYWLPIDVDRIASLSLQFIHVLHRFAPLLLNRPSIYRDLPI